MENDTQPGFLVRSSALKIFSFAIFLTDITKATSLDLNIKNKLLLCHFLKYQCQYKDFLVKAALFTFSRSCYAKGDSKEISYLQCIYN